MDDKDFVIAAMLAVTAVGFVASYIVVTELRRLRDMWKRIAWDMQMRAMAAEKRVQELRAALREYERPAPDSEGEEK